MKCLQELECCDLINLNSLYLHHFLIVTRSSTTQTVIPSVSTVAVWKVSLSVPGILLTNEN